MRLISRSEAQIAGLKRYFTGVPCRHGHIAERYVSAWACLDCQKPSTPASHARNQRKYAAKPASAAKRRERDRASINRQRLYRGLPLPTRPCPERCECCDGLPGKKALNLDHDHETGLFRGWLCSKCNAAIGGLGDTIKGVKKALRYLVMARHRL